VPGGDYRAFLRERDPGVFRPGAIVDREGRFLAAGEAGEVVIRGSSVIHGYENNPSANTSAFTNGWFRTGDQGRFDSDGYLFLTGRLKEIINRGGEKIAPAEIDEVLMQHAAVGQAIAFAVPHPTLGEDLAAAVVLKKDAAVTEREIRDFAAARLAEFKVPKQLVIVDEIPKGPTGKLRRLGLAERLADTLAQKLHGDSAAAKTSVEADLIEIWRSLLTVDQVGLGDNFYALGGDSLALAVLMTEIETRFKTTIPLDPFLGSPTIQTLAGLLQNASANGATRSPSSARTARPPGSKPIQDSVLVGLKNRLLQRLALYAPGLKTTRVWLHRLRGVSIGDNVSIGLDAVIETAYPRLVVLGNNVTLGMRAIIIAHLRDSTARARASGEPTVRIEDNVYIGPGAIVLPNVTIGHGAVVTAGSVVSRSIPAHTLARGNPARPIARCGVSLGGGVSYEEFLRYLTPIKDELPSRDRKPADI